MRLYRTIRYRIAHRAGVVATVRFRIEHGPTRHTYRELRAAGYSHSYSWLLARGLDNGTGT